MLPVRDLEQHLDRLFSYGFRPLFLCTLLSALLLIVWWIGIVEGVLPLPGTRGGPLAWHAHEMLFGFIGSAIGGFLLTAVANWTRRPPVQGLPLIVLVICWLGARVINAYNPGISQGFVILIDVSYWFLLASLMAREVLIAKNYRNLKIVAILFVFFALNLCFHLAPLPTIRATTLLVCILISVIGGRIIPAFTGNWLRVQSGPGVELPPAFNRYDQVVIFATVLLTACWAVFPYHLATGTLAILTGLLHLGRVSRWKGHLTTREPLLLVLHVGYAWLGFGFILLGSSVLSARFPVSTGIHAISIGAMAGLILAVSSRAALGHTNRPLLSGPLLSWTFVLINLAALTRVLAAAAFPELLVPSAAIWLTAFLLFGIRFAPVLLGPPRP